MDGLQPIVITAGPYSSFKAHPEWNESPQRVVTAYELCVFTEDGGGIPAPNGHGLAVQAR